MVMTVSILLVFALLLEKSQFDVLLICNLIDVA